MIGWLLKQTQRLGKSLAKLALKVKAWQPPWGDRRIKVDFVDQEPITLKPRRLYVSSTPNGPTFGYLLCPCGCGETLHLRFLPKRRPRWDIEIEADGAVSLTPSVWRQVGCRSHFVLKRGQIRWC